jgi:hypothetical protein
MHSLQVTFLELVIADGSEEGGSGTDDRFVDGVFICTTCDCEVGVCACIEQATDIIRISSDDSRRETYLERDWTSSLKGPK